jgi:hypothetical protein
MNIISAIQKHYSKQSNLLIPSSVDSVRHIFAKLATEGIVRGNRWNPFDPYFKLKIRWDGDIACLDGPYGAKMAPLMTQVTIQPSMSRDRTTLDLIMQFSIRYINISLLVASFLIILTLCLQLKSPDRSIIFLLWVTILLYGVNWMYLFYSSNIILKCLEKELSSSDRA